MVNHFIESNEIDKYFGKMLSLIQIVDQQLYEHMTSFGEHDHFYFGYRWFLLDFKRELAYADIYSVWETIWTSEWGARTNNFALFIALALILSYRQVIIENGMNYTDMIKFFNELAEKHNVTQIVTMARGLVQKLINLMESNQE